MEQPNVFGLFLPLLITTLPFIFLNGAISLKKGKNPILFAIYSIVPFVGFYLTIYLISLPDYALTKKVDKILDMLSGNDK